jgi:hypothetical protein
MEASGRRPNNKPPLHYLSFISSLSLPCHALVDTPSPSVSAVVEGEDGSVVRVYSSDGCPIGWCIHVSLFYKAVMPFHFMPPELAPLSHPVLPCVVRTAPRPWIRMACCSSPCHHPRSSSKRGHIGTR